MITDGSAPSSRRNWTLIWIAFGVLILIGEAAGGLVGQDAQGLTNRIAPQRLWWFVAIAWFVFWEYKGVRDGDGTFSQKMWDLYADKPARIPLVVGITVYLVMCLVSALSEFDAELSRLIVLASGAGIWLVIHFLTRGKYG